MKSILVVAGFVLTTSTAIGAQPIYIWGMTGTCEEMSVDGTDITDACQDNILQVAYDDGRVAVHAFAGDKLFVFSGAGDEKVGDQTRHDVDMMVLGTSGQSAMNVTARGECVYDDAYNGEARFECTASVKGYKPFKLVFVTDGSEPTDDLAM